ncbi:hypothetical protein TCAL_11189 [Tigriopus californicus]|uniref:G-protein coupled receptors family 1 profile domain-containing protein n=1 Tax=Tigriopus californicus TaxID=6832 RepID=A0A553P4X1_TIGCA|nr:neuropeptide F receptor-like [Tigriopus californicus]TRY72733.1 hypothetical protein TCAL_11189 [Tigriopus californicus]
MELGTDFSSPLPYYLNSTELEIVPERGIIALNYLNPYVGSPMVAEPVPPGINIFNIMNLTVADDVSRLEEWTILINPNSTKYAKLKSFFQEIRALLWNLDIPENIYYLLLALYIPIIILGSVLNLVILCIILSSNKLRVDPRNSFIVGLAFSDLSLCLFTSPLTLWYTLEGRWPLGGKTEFICKFVMAGQDFPIFMSSFCIGAIACDRFRFIVQSHRKQMTAKQAFVVSFVLGGISTAFVSPVFMTAKLWQYPYFGDRYFCQVDWVDPSPVNYTIIANSFHFLLTVVIVVCLYAAIYYRIRSRPPSQNPNVNRRRRRTNMFLAFITIFFFLSWTPSVLYSVFHDFFRQLLPERHSMPSVGYAFSLIFGLMSSIANPILYTSLNESFRDALRDSQFSRWVSVRRSSQKLQNRRSQMGEYDPETTKNNNDKIEERQLSGCSRTVVLILQEEGSGKLSLPSPLSGNGFDVSRVTVSPKSELPEVQIQGHLSTEMKKKKKKKAVLFDGLDPEEKNEPRLCKPDNEEDRQLLETDL